MKYLRFFLCTALLTTTCFAQITFIRTSHSPFSSYAVTGDFDRDGRPDIASLSFASNGDGLLVIYRGTSGGASKKVQYDIPTATEGNGIYTADVNGDGKLDIVFTKEFIPELEIWYGNGDATFKFGQLLNINSPAQFVGLGDVNKDGSIDIVTAEQNDTHSGSEVFLNNGSGTFARKTFVEAPRFMLNFAMADLNRDGKLDILFRTIDQFALFTGNGDGTFTAGPAESFAADVGTMVVGSFNADSAQDIAYRVPKCSTCANDTVYIFLNDGSGRLTLKATNHIGKSEAAIRGMAAGDLNNDGVMDIVFANTGGTTSSLDNSVVYSLNKGDGTFGSQVKVTSLSGGGGEPVLRHVSRDSQLDIIEPTGSLLLLLANNAPTNCTPPSSATLATNICFPTAATTSRTVTVRAAGDSPAGVARMELWVDGTKLFQVWSDQLRHTITLSPGTHRVTVQSFDKYTGLAKKVVSVTTK